jgi:hypothetical protein
MTSMERAALGSAMPGPDAATPDAPRALDASLRAMARRVRLQRALDAAVIFLVAGLGVGALGLCLLETGHTRGAQPLLWLAVALPALGLLLGALRPVAPLLSARLLDRSLRTPDLLASAWSFARIPVHERSPFMQACIARAKAAALRSEPSQALPLQLPRALLAAVGLALGVAALAALHVPAKTPSAIRAKAKVRLLQTEDLLAFEQEVAALLLEPGTDPSVREAEQELNALIEALRDQQLDRAQALAALRGLERRLDSAGLQSNDDALREAMRALADSVGRDSMARAVADALREADLSKTRAQLDALAQKVRERAATAQEQRRLAQALARAQQTDAAAAERLAKARAEVERLLKRKNDGPSGDARSQRLLRNKKRELERLEREQQEQRSSERQLDGLERKLSAAGQSMLAGKTEQGAQQLQEGAQALEKTQRDQASPEQRQRLRERVQQLRELISKQQQQRAGKSEKSQAGQGQRLSLQGFGRVARGDSAKADRGDAKPGGALLTPGRGGAADGPELMQAQGVQQTASEATPKGETGGEAPGRGGQPEPNAEPSHLASTRVDARVNGEQRDGPTRSEVISEAGQRGFASRSYQHVHGEYERHAEAVLERDKVPGGYRFYVRRYFQLIRPREAKDE